MVIEFFRDTLSGIYYYIYVAINMVLIFAIVGYIGEQREKENEEETQPINTQLNAQALPENNTISGS